MKFIKYYVISLFLNVFIFLSIISLNWFIYCGESYYGWLHILMLLSLLCVIAVPISYIMSRTTEIPQALINNGYQPPRQSQPNQVENPPPKKR